MFSLFVLVMCSMLVATSNGFVEKCPSGTRCVFATQCTVQSRIGCPSPQGAGICVHQCSANSDCQEDKLCCSNGCGMICLKPKSLVALDHCEVSGKVCCPLSSGASSYGQTGQSNPSYPQPTLYSQGQQGYQRPQTYGQQQRPYNPQPHSINSPVYYTDYYEQGYGGPPMTQEATAYLHAYRYSEECGVRNSPHGRISTGYTIDQGLTSYNEFKWHGAIFLQADRVLRPDGYAYAYKYRCGATIIHPAIALTAAHCVKGVRPDMLKVKFGEYNLQGSRGELFPPISRKVMKLFVHEEYNPANFKYDIALLVLSRPINLNRTPNVSPACLLPKDYHLKSHSKCYIVGWGMDLYKPNYGSNILKKASVSLQSDDNCKKGLVDSVKYLATNFFHGDSQSCFTGGFGKDACVGDGGGAVVCPVSNKDIPVCTTGYACEGEHYFVAGVVSWGSDLCGQENSVTVYADLSQQASWIENKIRPAGGFSHYDHKYWYTTDNAYSTPGGSNPYGGPKQGYGYPSQTGGYPSQTGGY